MRHGKPLQIFVVDAFAARLFSGNPAGVCLVTEERSPQWMQDVAAEMNLSETAFLTRLEPDLWQLRWFTPTVEVALCGHATLAAAHILWTECGLGPDTLWFATRSGRLSATRDAHRIRLDFPAQTPRPEPTTAALVDALGVHPQWVGRGGDDLLAVLASGQEVRALTPDLARLSTLDARGIIVSARSDDPAYDCVSRFFAPRVGVPEDPVTGSAHCCLGPYWAARLGKTELRAFQASPRGGVLGVAVQGDRVHLHGTAITVLSGTLRA